MRLAPGFRSAGQHFEIDLPGARALFTTRLGGVSPAPFDSLNLGLATTDEPDRVQENRRRLVKLTGDAARRLASGRQVHGTHVERVTGCEQPVRDADGQATHLPDVAAVVVVADCLPVAIAGEGAVAMIHAGWRGLAGGVLEEGVAAVRELGADGRLEAALGPGASVCCYEVGEEVRAAFAGEPGAATGSRMLDLRAIATARLHGCSVEVVHDCELCTICNPASFYSHRRDGKRSGRQAGAVWRT